MFAEPVFRGVERARREAAGSDAAGLDSGENAGALKHAYMLHERGQRNVVSRRERGDRRLTSGKARHDGTPHRIGECTKGLVET